MARFYNLSPMNTLWFVLSDAPQNALHHYTHLGGDLHKYRGRPFETVQDYLQPIQYNDIICVQYEENNSGSPTITAHDELGNLAATFYPTSSTVSGNFAPDGSQLYTYTWKFKAQSNLSADGNYTFKLNSSFSTNAAEFISEPVELKADHEDTLYFRYHHSVNDYDTLFQFTNLEPQFSFRVPGTISKLQPDTDDTSFDDQTKNLTLLSSTPFRTHRFNVGGDNGVPDWVLEKLNWILACDSMAIDGVKFVKEDDSKWEIKEAENYSGVGATITIREHDNMTPYRYSNNKALLLTIPGYPAFIQKLFMSQGLGNVVVAFDTPLYSSADVTTNIVTPFNTTQVPVSNLEGSLSFDDPDILYDNMGDESYSVSQAAIWTSYIKLTVDIANASQTFEIRFSGGKIGVDWGDGTTQDFTAPSSSAFTTVSHTFSTIGTKTIYVFDDGSVTKYSFSQNNANKLTNVEGALPGTIQDFTIANQNVPTLADSLFVNVGAAFLKLQITDSHFVNFTGNIFAANTSMFPNLDLITLVGNEMDGADIDQFIDDIVSGVDVSGGGFLSVSGQTPAATVNTSSYAYYVLVNAGWFIIV